MSDRIADTRRRILDEASRQTGAEWTATVTNFYRTLQLHHPALAKEFIDTDMDGLIRRMVALLYFVAKERPDRDTLDRLLPQLGRTHIARGIGAPAFSEFIGLLANSLADVAHPSEREAAHNVWYQELVELTDAMLLTARD